MKKKIDNYKLKYMLYVLIFSLCLTFIACFYLGTHFGVEVLSVSNTEYKREEKIDNNLKLIQNELDQLFSLLNTKDINSCSLFGTDYLSHFRYEKNNYDFLSLVSPLMMECMYGGKFNLVDNNKVMSLDTYKLFREYFNVSLDSNIIYNYKSYINSNNFTYKLNDIIKINQKYRAIVDVYEGNVYISKGTIIVSVNDNHIFYESFILNEN